MSFARRLLILALAVQAVGFVREIVFGIGIERYVTTLTTLSDPSIVVATAVFLGVLGLLAPVWHGHRWATLATIPLMVVLLAAVVPASVTLIGNPSVGNFAVWLTVTIILVAAVVGIPLAVVATLESFGRLRPSAAVRAEGGFAGTTLFIAAVFGSIIGMTTVALAVAASPSASGSVGVGGAPDDTLAVTMHELRFEPGSLALEVGKTTAVFVTNQDAFDHSFDIDELDIHVHVAAGQTAVVMVEPTTTAGPLRLYCGIPGHAEAGMVANLSVD